MFRYLLIYLQSKGMFPALYYITKRKCLNKNENRKSVNEAITKVEDVLSN